MAHMGAVSGVAGRVVVRAESGARGDVTRGEPAARGEAIGGGAAARGEGTSGSGLVGSVAVWGVRGLGGSGGPLAGADPGEGC